MNIDAARAYDQVGRKFYKYTSDRVNREEDPRGSRRGKTLSKISIRAKCKDINCIEVYRCTAKDTAD